MQAKLAELMDFVETHMVDAARHQKQEYDKHMGIRTFKAGDLVWLSIPMAGKLDPSLLGRGMESKGMQVSCEYGS